MGRIALAILLLLSMLGCSHEAQDAPEGRAAVPTLRVSDSLSPELQAAARLAAGDWREAGLDIEVQLASGLEANLVPGSCSDLAPGAAGCYRPEGLVQLDLGMLSACKWVRVDGLTQCLKLDPAAVIRHELGHWLGLGYHLPDGNVMQAHYSVADGYPTVLTALDIEAVQAAHSAREKW